MWPISSTHYDAERRIWSGPKLKDLYNENITLGEVIGYQLLKNPKKVIQIHDATAEKMTCEELLHSAETLAKYLLEVGVRTGDVIGLYAGNSSHVVTVMLASFLCGTPVNPLFPDLDKDHVSMLYKITRPKIIFCDVENYETARNVSEELKLNARLIVVNGSVEGLRNVRDLIKSSTKGVNQFRFPCRDLKGSDTAAILCSSGTTGPPKGTMFSHQTLVNNNFYPTLKSDSVLFNSSPMHWSTGFLNLISSLVNACLRIVSGSDFKPDYFPKLAQRYKITHAYLCIEQIVKLSQMDDIDTLQRNLATIDTIIVSGGKLHLMVEKKMHEILSNNLKRAGLSRVYGLTEVGANVSFNGGYLTERLVGSEGKLMPNTKVRVIDKNGQSLGPNEQGEICISRNYHWSGYYLNEEANRKAFVDGWLHSGDIGYFNDDGFLHYCSRDADVFKTHGRPIYPQMLEEIIAPIPGVCEMCVIGVPDLFYSYLTGCAVVRTADEIGWSLTCKDIENQVKAKMANMYHFHGGVYFLDAMPKTATGKIQRKKVLEIVLHMRGEVNIFDCKEIQF